MDPIAQLIEDRARARAANDPWANLCALASVDGNGQPQVRTLVLRELQGRLAIFVNATSPKWEQLKASRVAVSTYFGTPDVQYRLQGTTEPVPRELVAESWLLRPPMPQRMDWLYAEHPQSTAIESRDELVQRVLSVDLPEPLHAPESANGLYLVPERIERLDLAQDNGIHDRRAWALEGDTWVETVLVP